MRILSYQPFSLFANGGGSRILRRLYEGREPDIISLVIESYRKEIPEGNIREITLPAFPQMQKWHRWYYRDVVRWFRTKVFRQATINKIRKAASAIPFDVLHVVDQGIFVNALCTSSFSSGKKLWSSFHDHFSTNGGIFENTQVLWNMSDRRLVISRELGEEYQSLFGKKDFEVITDGLKEEEISEVAPVGSNSTVTIYFSGLLHIDYYPLFETLAKSLDILSDNAKKYKLVLRGTQTLSFLENRKFEVEYLPFILDDKVLKQELDSAAILYLPIKFTVSDFYQFSLSTKMVGYLGGAGVILYHGPGDSAACKLLKQDSAAITCTTVEANELVEAIKKAASKDATCISQNAKQLAKREFLIATIQRRFWQN
jgi:hypothetical protein